MQAGANPTIDTTDIADIDVLVVGAGPVGLTMACELLRHGVRCRIIDQAPEPTQTSRALAIHARTLEVFEDMGVVDQMVEQGTKAQGVTGHDGDRTILRLSLDHIREQDSQYPFLLILPQNRTEAILTERLGELGGTVERSRELFNLESRPTSVTAQVRTAGTEAESVETIRARWLIGCDGASSRVRKASAIPFEGSTAPEEWLLADVDLDWDKTRQTTHGWFTRRGPLVAFPLPTGQWRLIVPAVPESLESSEPPDSPEFLNKFLNTLQQLFAQFTGDTTTTLCTPSWMSKFRVSYRLAATYRKDRVFLAGDAAHIHSPFGGQGMNIGIQDAYNLAWKLALVHQGHAQETLLDTYQEERRPIARYILRGTQVATQGLLITQNPVLRWLRDRLAFPLLQFTAVQRRLVQEASELNMNYRSSSLAGSVFENGWNGWNLGDRLLWQQAPHAGDRALPGECWVYGTGDRTNLHRVFCGTESHLLLFAGLDSSQEALADLTQLAADAESWTDHRVKSHLVIPGDENPSHRPDAGSILLDPDGSLHRRYGAQGRSLYLVRPDGYIGFRCQPASPAALLDYLQTLFAKDAVAVAGRSPHPIRHLNG